HGWGKTENYFEGWYFKIIDPTEQYALAIIPGISRDAEGVSHAFIQVLNGKKCTAAYYTFDAKTFQPSSTYFALQIAHNSFSAKGLQVDLPELKADIQFKHTTPWPKMLGAPGIMGWFSFVPFMQCYHGVVSLYHQIVGVVEIAGKTIDFTDGIGYLEKDWGKSFPSAWIWMQTNHFDHNTPISLTASVANIPWLGSYFVGYIVGFWWEERLYRFATYTGAKMKAQLEERSVQLSFKDTIYRLEIEAKQANGADLVSPISGSMAGKVNESMQAAATVRFFKKDQLLFEGIGRNMGMEIAGEVDKLLTTKWRR
ncbi:MAG: tocopherol cyclase family protein, partial [Bacteroidota bacterium]